MQSHLLPTLALICALPALPQAGLSPADQDADQRRITKLEERVAFLEQALTELLGRQPDRAAHGLRYSCHRLAQAARRGASRQTPQAMR